MTRQVQLEQTRQHRTSSNLNAGSFAAKPNGTAAVSARVIAALQAAILTVAPGVMLAGFLSHPSIGNPTDPGFLERLAAVVAANPTQWAISHFLVAVGCGLLVLAFLAVRSRLRKAGDERWSLLGFPLIIMGSTLYAMLPAMEFAALAAAKTGSDIQAIQAALMPWFKPILISGSVLFALGVLGFVVGIARTRMLSPLVSWFVIGALIVMAAARFVPSTIIQFDVQGVAGVLALWPLAYWAWKDR